MFLGKHFLCLSPDGGAAGGGSGGGAAGESGSGEGTKAGEQSRGSQEGIELPKSADELTKIIQAETAKAVTEATEKLTTEFNTKLETEKTEAVRLAKLSGEEREKEQEKKRKDELDQRESTIKQQELTLKATDMLTAKNLPLEIRSMVIGKDEADTKSRIEAFEGVFQKAVEAAVSAKLAGSAKPGAGKEPDEEAAIRSEIARGLGI